MSQIRRAGSPLEIELKYRVIDAAAGDRYLAVDEIAGFRATSPVRSTQVEDRYIDTADGAMARAGFAARLRQTAKTTTVAVKSSVRRVGTGNVHRREELEGPADRTAHPRDWPPSDARSLILEQCGDAPLVEVVTIRQLRRKRILEHDGTSVELSLDEVDAVSRSRVVGRFVELEVELIEGREAGLAAIDRELAVDPGLAPADTSKLQSALRAVAAAQPKRSRRAATVLAAIDDDPAAALPVPPIGSIVEAVLAELEAAPAADAPARGAASDEPDEAANEGGANEAGAAKTAGAARAAAEPEAAAEPGPGPPHRRRCRQARRRDERGPGDGQRDPAPGTEAPGQGRRDRERRRIGAGRRVRSPPPRRRQDPGRPRRRPRRRGRAEGPPVPPRPDDRPRGRHP